MTIKRGGINLVTIPAGASVVEDVVLDWQVDYTAHVTGDAEGRWTFTVLE